MVKAFAPKQVMQILVSMTLLLSACAKESSNEKLPDDPTSEPAPTTGTGGTTTPVPPQNPLPPPSTEETILKQYDHLDPQNQVPDQALKEAVLYFHANQSNFANKNIISVIDFDQSSKKPRFFVINLKTGAVWAMTVSHGTGSDRNHDSYAESFSNVSGSQATSIGFYKTAETYQGSNGYSLRLDGLSRTNSNARVRAIVIHGAAYVQDREVIQGRSWGCPALSLANYVKAVSYTHLTLPTN